MAEIKLLSIKRNEEASYFYDNDVSTTLDSNRNKVVEVEENYKTHQISKKGTKEEEKRSMKEQKQKAKELKQREKEKKKSLKNSRKEVVGSVDTGRPNDDHRAEIKTNDDVKTNGSFQVGMDVDKGAKDKNEESLTGHEEDKNEEHDVTRHEHEETLNRYEETLNQHEEALKQHEDLSKEHEQISSEHDLSIKTHEESAHENVELTGHATASEEPGTYSEERGISNEGHADLELSSGNRAERTREVEETIRSEGAHTTDEAPPDIFYQPMVNPEIPEPTGGQHVEIEISEVTDLEVDASSSDQVVVMQYSPQTSTYQNSAASESQILVATVQQVESGVNVDSFFAECYGPGDDTDKEEKRKSVRFQEETEEIGHGENESKDREYASLNLGGDFTGTSDDDSAEPPQTLEPAVEIVNKEERDKVESCVDLDNIFASSEREPNGTETVPNEAEQNHIGVAKVNGSAKVNGKAKVGNGRTNMGDLVEINLNDSNEHKNTAVMKKEKRKRNGLMRCCFP